MYFRKGDVAFMSNLMYVLKVEIERVNKKEGTYKVKPIGFDLSNSVGTMNVQKDALFRSPKDVIDMIIINSVRYGKCGKELDYPQEMIDKLEFKEIDKNEKSEESK